MTHDMKSESANHHREKLREKRSMLKERLEAIKRDIARGLDRDSAEQAVELENAEVLDEIGRVTLAELERIEAELAFHE